MKKNFLPSVFIYTEETEETKPSKAKPRKNEFAIREIKHSQNLILSKIYSIKRSYLSHPEDRHFFSGPMKLGHVLNGHRAVKTFV